MADDCSRCREELARLTEENAALRRAALAFGGLAERLNLALQEERRAQQRASVVSREATDPITHSAAPVARVPDERIHESSAGLRVGRMDNYSSGFVDDEQRVVLEKDVDRCGVRLDRPCARESSVRDVHRQHVAGRDSRRDPANGLPIDADGSSIDPRLNSGAGG